MVKQWDIYWCQLDPGLGCEKKGLRPVLVVSRNAVNSSLSIVTILPFSSVKNQDKIYPTEVFLPANVTGLEKDSVVMIHQIRTLSQSRLLRKSGSLEDSDYRESILASLREYFEE
ncbi:MAG TPA: type II toxin-antitoxin system PemK/MazF family toxin [Caldisericia bacterium]|jgi:mRNA interferase MazF|nr:type II toxin-antitoxin system PemK/MazF family toxin [Caldisericia bacterium]